MTQSVAYNTYRMPEESKGAGAVPIVLKSICIQGGAGIPSHRSGFGDAATDSDGHPIWTAAGFVTPVSDSNFEYLKENPTFKKHMESGFVKVINENIVGNHGAVKKQVSSMEKKDGFNQLAPGGVDKRIKITTGSIEQEGILRL